MKSCIYPGSFDPITNGHLDVIRRASGLFDKTIVAVLQNGRKQTFFSVDERVAFIRKATEGIRGVEVATYGGLLADFLRERKVHFVLRGLRAISDFDYEFQMSATNSALNPEMETVFLMPSLKYSYLSSSIVREVGSLGGNLHGMLPDGILAEISNRLKNRTEEFEMNVIDLLHMLEEEIENSSSVPLTRKKMVDKEAALDIISRIRINMPEDIKQAQMLNLEHQRIIRDAQEEGEAVIRDARRKADQLVDGNEITQRAYDKAQDIMSDAQKNAKEIRTGAKAYADDVLRELERYLNDNLKMLAKNRAEMSKK